MQPLDRLDIDNVRNIYLYIADGVRYDFLPDQIAELGVTTKMISDSIHSPTSFSSIVTGLHYPQHRVADFSQRLPEEAPNLLHNFSHNTNFCNTINHPPFNDNPETDSILMDTLRTDDAPSDIVETVDPPFVIVERGRGGHAPYGSFDGSGSEYFSSRGDSTRTQIINEYEEGVMKDAEWFLSQVDTMKKRGLKDETLILYISDHGELLGENGNYGHNMTMHRKLAQVPCVFIHPSLPNSSIRRKIIRHVDLLPTIQAAADIEISSDYSFQGRNVIVKPAPKFGTCYYSSNIFSESKLPTVEVEFKSAWDDTGGHIIPCSRRSHRAITGLWMMIRGPQAQLRRKQSGTLLADMTKGVRISGAPKFSQKTALDVLRDIEQKERPSPSDDSLEVQTERLEELGYL